MDLIEGLRRIEVDLQPVERGLHVELHPERDGAGLKNHVWIEEDERLRDKPVRRKSALAMPDAIEIGDWQARMLRFYEENAFELVVLCLCEVCDVIAKSGFEPPFRFGALTVGWGRSPAAPSAPN
jgi:hypothetical protein